MADATLYTGDSKQTLKSLPAESVQTCVTSPPYWGLRDYGEEGQLGLEETPDEYVENLVQTFREVRRVLAEDGTLWLNLGDTYASAWACNRRNKVGNGSADYEARSNRLSGNLKEKDLVGIPWRVALALQDDGWWLRSDIIWNKPNPMPESVTDRPTSSHEHIFLLSKSKRYYYDHEAVKEDAVNGELFHGDQKQTANRTTSRNGRDSGENTTQARNRRDVWTVSTKPYPEAHFAVYPPDLIEDCVLAGSAEGDTVLDPFSGAGTTGLVALAKGREYIGIDLSRDYNEMAAERIESDAPLLNTATIK